MEVVTGVHALFHWGHRCEPSFIFCAPRPVTQPSHYSLFPITSSECAPRSADRTRLKKTMYGENPPLDVADLISGYRQIIARAHIKGIKVVIGTLMAFTGAPYFTPEKEAIRQAANKWRSVT